MPPNWEIVYELVRNGKHEFTRHASRRVVERDLSFGEASEAILNGQMIEDYPNDKYGPSCLILGLTNAGKVLHVQISYPPVVKIVTAYPPSLTNGKPIIRRGKVEMDHPTERDQCYYCGGHQFEQRLISHLQPYKGHDYLFTNVPAKVCLQCGEAYFSGETHDMILDHVRRNTPTRIENIPVFDLSKAQKKSA